WTWHRHGRSGAGALALRGREALQHFAVLAEELEGRRAVGADQHHDARAPLLVGKDQRGEIPRGAPDEQPLGLLAAGFAPLSSQRFALRPGWQPAEGFVQWPVFLLQAAVV